MLALQSFYFVFFLFVFRYFVSRAFCPCSLSMAVSYLFHWSTSNGIHELLLYSTGRLQYRKEKRGLSWCTVIHGFWYLEDGTLHFGYSTNPRQTVRVYSYRKHETQENVWKECGSDSIMQEGFHPERSRFDACAFVGEFASET